MKDFGCIIVIATLSFMLFSSTALAFGEVAGTIVLHATAGGSDMQNWGIFNNESITVSLSAQGDGAQYITFPQTVTLPAGNQIYWIPITANIPSNYDLTQGTNITGQLYALAQGSPGQVQINLQVEKNFQILIQAQAANQAGTINSNPSSQNPSEATASSTVSNTASSATSSNAATQSSPDIVNAVQQTSGLITAFFALKPTFIAVILGLIFLIGIIYFAMKRNGGE